MPDWSIYLLRCADGSVYTGITTDVARRVDEHQSGDKGAKYLRGRGPLVLLYQRAVGSRSQASRLEHQVKKLAKAEKDDVRLLDELVERLLTGQVPRLSTE
jgi:putative endonuclease